MAFRLTLTYYYSLVDIFLILLCFIVFDFLSELSLLYAKYTERKRTLFPYDHELERTLRNMHQNLGINDEDLNKNIPDPVDVHGQMLPDAPGEHQ